VGGGAHGDKKSISMGRFYTIEIFLYKGFGASMSKTWYYALLDIYKKII
jgi:hypothetical protein